MKETLEEVAEKYIQSKNPQWTPYHRQSFIDGAKWQQERMYSEKEVLKLLKDYNEHTLKLQALKLGNSFNVEDYFEQFKKK